MVSKLTHICNEEGIHIEPEGLRLMARSATGSLRDAENLLQQLTTYYGSEIELHQIQAILGVTGDWRVKELVKHIINNDVSAGMTTINSVNSDGLDLKQFNRELVEYLRGLLLIKTGSDEAVDFTDGDIAELKDLAVKASLPQILKVVKLFGQLELGFDNYSTLPLELALVDCVLPAEEKKGSPISQAESRQPVKTAPPPVTSTEPEPSIAKSEPTTVPEAVATPLTTVPEAATTPPTIVPEAATTPPQPGNEIEQLRLNWKRIIDEAPADIRKTRAIAFLRSANVKPVAIEDDAVILSIKYDVHKEQIEKPENLMVAEKIVSDFLRRPCRVRCIHKPEDNHLLRAALKMGAQVTSVEEK
jgi:DNA polymerase-3 subunit gamma/tau